MADHPHTIDRWDDATGENLIEQIAAVGDYLVALETYRAAVKRWPKDKITLRPPFSSSSLLLPFALAAPNKYLAQNDKSSDGRNATKKRYGRVSRKNDMQRIKPYAQYALAILGIAAFNLVLPATVYALHLYLDAPQ